MKFHYLKGNFFRVIHVDGAIGGPTPNGMIHAALFSERFPIPIQTTNELKERSVIGVPISTVMRDGVVREVEADLMMTVETAKRIASWLTETAAAIESASQEKGTSL